MKESILSYLEENLIDFEIPQGSEQRTVGDLVEYKVREICQKYSIENGIKFVDRRSKKSLEDFTLVEKKDNIEVYNYFDPKTHDEDADFSMPNLSSVDKLKKLLENPNQNLLNVFVSYKITNNFVSISHIDVRYIWELDFSILRIGSLGKGQLQISDMKKGILLTQEGRDEWYGKLKKLVNTYHVQQIKRIEKEKLKWL